MKKVLFVCHGNVCRSVTAEYVFKYLVSLSHQENNFYTESKATSREEIGNDIYPPMKRVLDINNIPYQRHYARQVVPSDYNDFDLIFVMDEENMYGIKRIIPFDKDKKIYRLKDYVGENGDIEDPWYSGRYQGVYEAIKRCVTKLLEMLQGD